MKVVAVYSWARDVGSALVHADGTVTWRSTKTAPGEDDHAVLAVARALAEAGQGEAVGLMLGEGDASWALARGLGATVRVADAPALEDESATAAVLAAAVERIGGVDVVVVADSEEHPVVGVALAARLGRPVLAGVLSATLVDGRVEARRRTGAGEETVAVPVPAVLVVAAEGSEPRAPGMKELLAARKRPVEVVPCAELGVTVADVEVRSATVPEVTGARLFEGDPTTAARELVAALRSEGVL